MKTNISKTIIAALAIVMCHTIAAQAQNGNVKKAAEAVFTLTTFNADGSIIATTNGVFVDNNGTAIAPWTPFVGADHATITDSKGTKHNVESLTGANAIYDMAKFNVSGTVPAFIACSTQKASASSQTWIVPNKKSDTPKEATVSSVETFMNNYAYYIVRTDANEMCKGCPAVDNSGKLLGLYTPSATTQSITDAQLPMAFTTNGMSQNDPTLRLSNIRISLPNDEKQAQLALMLSAEQGERNYEATTEEFISKFPKNNDGYYAKALITAGKQTAEQAEAILQTAIKNVTNKAEAHYNYSRFMLSLASATDDADKKSQYLDKSLEQAKEAQSLFPEPAYKQLEAQAYYEKGDFQQAYDTYMSLTNGELHNGEPYYRAALSREQLGGTDTEILELLNKAVEACDTPYTVVAAPYFLARGIQYDKMKDYRKAMSDLYLYEALMNGQLGAPFYFMRGQSEAKGRIYQPALNDIAHAIAIDPRNTMYWAELASLNLRVNKLPEAIKAAEQCIALDADMSEAYLVMGIAQIETGKKTEGIKNIEKAKSLGNEQADTFLNKYK